MSGMSASSVPGGDRITSNEQDLPVCEDCLKERGTVVRMVKAGYKGTVGWRGAYECPECGDYGKSVRPMDDPYYRIATGIVDELADRGLDLDDIRRVVDRTLWITERQYAIQARRSAEEELRRDAITHLEELRTATIRDNNKRSDNEFLARHGYEERMA